MTESLVDTRQILKDPVEVESLLENATKTSHILCWWCDVATVLPAYSYRTYVVFYLSYTTTTVTTCNNSSREIECTVPPASDETSKNFKKSSLLVGAPIYNNNVARLIN